MIPFTRYGPLKPESEEKFPGEGMPSYRNPNERGDMIVHFKVDYPQTLTETQRTSLREIFSEKAAPKE
jgi:DnaJ family protein B protein 4